MSDVGFKTWAPLWNTIVTSTLWGESKEVRLLFVTMLALKDVNGIVLATTAGLQRLANLDSFAETAAALKVLESPDQHTDTPQEFEGRRIERIPGGWKILNHLKHRNEIEVNRKEYQRRKQKEYRARLKEAKPAPGQPQARKGPETPSVPAASGHNKVLREEGQEAADALFGNPNGD